MVLSENKGVFLSYKFTNQHNGFYHVTNKPIEELIDGADVVYCPGSHFLTFTGRVFGSLKKAKLEAMRARRAGESCCLDDPRVVAGE